MNRILAGTALLFFMSLPSGGFGQATPGQITGTVTNESGVKLPEATINLRNEDTGATLSTFTTESGDYSFLVPLGQHYTLTAQMEGYKQTLVTKIPVGTAKPIRIDIGLKATVTVCSSRGGGVGGMWSTGSASDNNLDHQMTITMSLFAMDRANRMGASVSEARKGSGPETWTVIHGDAENVKEKGTSFEFTASAKVNNATVETVYKGQLVDADTLNVLRSTTKGKPVDLKSDGTAETLVLRRIFLGELGPLC